jgi:hypothetical protein
MAEETQHPEDTATAPVVVLDTGHADESVESGSGSAETATVVEPVEHTDPVAADGEPVAQEKSTVDDLDEKPAVDEKNVVADMRFFGNGDVDGFRTDWRSVQAGFVDDPDAAVHAADELIARVVDTVTARITARRRALADPKAIEADDRVEAQRLVLRRYRTLFEQLLTVDPT